MRALAVALALALATAPGQPDAEPGEAPAVPRARGIEQHGRVVLDNFSSRSGNPAAVFDHWRHRALFTCRVCHVDLGFALGAGETQVSASANEDGAYCGACHDGKTRHAGRTVFAACSGWPQADAARGCTRCHTGGKDDQRQAYGRLARRMPTDPAGFVDWAAAVRQGRIAPVDAIAGVTVKRPAMRIDRDVTMSVEGKGTWLGNVTFSHKKHAALNGCELCHPEVFPVTARGATRFRMADVQAGAYCGVCHRNVAFPLDECGRCHASSSGASMFR